jgi:hypothetical protein
LFVHIFENVGELLRGMVNINLSTSSEDQKNAFPLKEKLAYLIIIAVVWLGVYGGIFLYQGILEKKIETANSEKLNKENVIKESNNKDVFDFQNRLLLANSLVGKKSDTLESLRRIQEVMVEGVYIISYNYNEKNNSLAIIGETTNYNTVAKQILNFKKSEYFSNVEVVDISLKEGKINFSLKTTINQNIK